MAQNHSPTFESPVTANKSHPKKNSTTHQIWLTNRGSLSSTFMTKNFSNRMSTPQYRPHRRKFHAAPCQMPVRPHTIMVLATKRGVLTRLPPSGMYT